MSGEGIKVQEKFYYLRFPAKPVSTNEIKDHYLARRYGSQNGIFDGVFESRSKGNM